MMEEKEIQEAERNIPRYLEDGLLTKNPDNKQFASFYLNNAKMSFQLANFLFRLSTEYELKRQMAFYKIMNVFCGLLSLLITACFMLAMLLYQNWA